MDLYRSMARDQGVNHPCRPRPGQYRWGVRTMDSSMAGSRFATGTFTIDDFPPSQALSILLQPGGVPVSGGEAKTPDDDEEKKAVKPE